MSLFRKIFGATNPASEEEKDNEYSQFIPDADASLDEKFIYNFKKKNFFLLQLFFPLNLNDQRTFAIDGRLLNPLLCCPQC